MRTKTAVSLYSRLRALASASGFQFRRYTFPIILSLLAAMAEVVSLALLVPAVDIFTRESGKSSLVLKLEAFLPAEISARPEIFTMVIFGSVVIFAALKSLFMLYAVVKKSQLSTEFSNSIRKYIFRHLIGYGPLYFKVNSKSLPLTAINSHCSTISERMLKLTQSLTNLFALSTYSVLLLSISPLLTLVTVVTLPLLYTFHHLVFNRIRHSARSHYTARDALASYVKNFYDNFDIVIASGVNESEISRFNHVSDVVASHEYSLHKKHNIIYPVNELFVLGVLIFICIAIWYLSSTIDNTSVAAYGIFLLTLKRMSNQLNGLSGIKMNMVMLDTTVSHLSSLLEPENTYSVPDGTKEAPSYIESVEFQNVSFGYTPSAKALNDISCVFEGGRVTAIIGQTGAGKSTLMQLLLRFADPDSGEILVNGEPLPNLVLDSWRSLISYVSQDTYLFDASVYENCVFGISPAPDEATVLKALEKASLLKVVNQLPQGLHSLIGEKGSRLSGGERQRLSIVRALLKNSPIILLDEATSALDSNTEKYVHEAISELSRGRTTIIVAHRLSTIMNADHILTMENGEIIESGTLNDLLAKEGQFYTYWKQQNLLQESTNLT